MTPSELLQAIEHAGGSVALAEDGSLLYDNVPAELEGELVAAAYLAKALLKERRASQLWEESLHDGRWWAPPRDSLGQRIDDPAFDIFDVFTTEGVAEPEQFQTGDVVTCWRYGSPLYSALTVLEVRGAGADLLVRAETGREFVVAACDCTKLLRLAPEANNTDETGDDMKWKKEHREYEKPSEGVHLATIWDVVDLGDVEEATPEGKVTRHKARISFVTDEIGKDGKTQLTIGKRVNVSFGEKSTLVKICNSTIHRNPVPTDDVDWDPDELIGKTLLIEVEHSNWKGGIFVDVSNTMPAPKGAVLAIPESLVQARNKRLGRKEEEEELEARKRFAEAQPANGHDPRPTNGHAAAPTPALSEELPESDPSEPPPTDSDMPFEVSDEDVPF